MIALAQDLTSNGSEPRCGLAPVLPDRELRYRWYEGLASLRGRAYPRLSFERVERALFNAEAFVENWAAVAEQYGCQPAHIMRPPADDGTPGGLAWRWDPYCRPIAFAPRVVIAKQGVLPAWSWLLDVSGGASLQDAAAHAQALSAAGL